MNILSQTSNRNTLLRTLKSRTIDSMLWWIALVIFPIATVLWWIWPSKLYGDRMNEGWKVFAWILYIPLYVGLVLSKMLLMLFVFLCAIDSSFGQATVTKDNIEPPRYSTVNDFYKLTGVEFPELKLVDSLFYDDGFLPSYIYHEYKFVVHEDIVKDFHKRLDEACEYDSKHWNVEAEEVNQITSKQKKYSYWIYPDSEPVDRCRGNCDRMVKMDDGSVVEDWDGNYVSVEVVNDTVILRYGWLR